MNAHDIYEIVRAEGVIAIVRGTGTDVIVDIAEALYAGGIKLLEVTCNTPGFAEMITLLADKMAGKMAIGAGTVLTKDLCNEAISAGAKYVVAPDVNPEVIKYCLTNDIAVFPGAATATEILTAARLGAKMIKIFPAASIGIDYIKQLRGPIDNVDFLAVGGVRLDNISEFMKAGCIGIGIGGSVIRKEIVESKDWSTLTAESRLYVETVAANKS